MKAIKQEGYLVLINDNKKPVYCIHKAPVQSIIPDKLGQPLGIEIPVQSSLCGDHCPFFEIDQNTNLVTLHCATREMNIGINEITDQPENKLNLKLIK